MNLMIPPCYMPKLELAGILVGCFDYTIHSTCFSCNINWGAKNGMTVVEAYKER